MKSIIVYRLALGMECRVVRSGTQQCDTPMEGASWYALPMCFRGDHLLFIQSNLWLPGLCCGPTDHLVYSDGLSPLTSV